MVSTPYFKSFRHEEKSLSISAWFTRVRIPLGLLPVAVRLEQTLASQICLTMDEVGPRKVVIDQNKR